MRTQYLVGCDIGTGGTKAVVMSIDGELLGSHFVEYPLIVPRPGWAEHDPEWYWQATVETIRTAIQKSRIDYKKVIGLALSSLSPACILINREGNPLQNSHIWMDRRGTDESRWLKEKIGVERVFHLSGNPIDSYYGTVKLLWEKNHRPELYRNAVAFLTPKDFVVRRLTGQVATDYSNASVIGIVFNIVKRQWDFKLIEEVDLNPELFPPVFPCDKLIGEVNSESAKKCGLPPGTPVAAGTTDCNAAWTSMGVIEPGENALVMGSTGVWGVVHTEPHFTPNLITIVHTANSQTHYTTLGALVGCGSLIRYFRDHFGHLEHNLASQLGINAYEVMDLEANSAPAGCDGLIVLPYFMGERTPIWDPLARGVVFGLSFAHGRGHLIRAFMESVGFGILQNMNLIRESRLSIASPTLFGEGGARSLLWRKIISNICNIESGYIEKPLGAPVGNAICAGVAVGAFKGFDVSKEFVKYSEIIHPDPEINLYYQKLFTIYCKLYNDLNPRFKELAEVTGFC